MNEKEVFAGQHADVGRNHVARGQFDDVAGHEVFDGLFDGGAVAEDGGRDIGGFEFGGGHVGAQFLYGSTTPITTISDMITADGMSSVKRETVARMSRRMTRGFKQEHT